MDVSVKFLGAAQIVTGSKYLLDIDSFRLLIDCGLFQGKKEDRLKNWSPFPINPDSIDAILLTHAHIDHIGYLPRLCKQGFRGAIYCTDASLDLIPMMLKDAAKLQEEEAQYAEHKQYSKHDKPQPLYTLKDVDMVLPLLVGIPFEKEFFLNEQVSFRYQYAGHILGAGIIELFLKGNQMNKKIVFSGDLGRSNDPVLYPPKKIAEADFLFVESTYGNRNLTDQDPRADLASIINETLYYNGCILIPAFALGRTQAILYYLKQLFKAHKISPCRVFIDSPMAMNATDIYNKNKDLCKASLFEEDNEPFDFDNLYYCHEQQASMQINDIKSNAIIISASGMATGGRILHHLYHRLPRENDTLLFVGYQGEGTRGRRILNGEPEVRIFGEFVPVKCKVTKLDGLSAHADSEELFEWLSSFQEAPKNTFIVHGEKESAEALAKTIKEKLGWNTFIPQYLESYQLFEGI
ncbi:metallo-beta-lactamase family protein [Thermoflexibacter ruber]|uniref:Metallo-beta-lactamase family protein n=2 Tax=Thermoflexibacter ruber TaxID=1003 RepID=A0A1I2J6N2_9BACT|nr:metallo-beta-lactamase family protein [Thermoflexibacter ruber]